jgi:hypothetical protein
LKKDSRDDGGSEGDGENIKFPVKAVGAIDELKTKLDAFTVSFSPESMIVVEFSEVAL